MGLVVINVNPLNVYVNTWMATGGILDMLFDLVLFSFPIFYITSPDLNTCLVEVIFPHFRLQKVL